MKPQIMCPKCFARYPQDECLLVCLNSACPAAGERIAESSAVMEGSQPHCPDCGREITMRLCPRCGFEYSGHDPGARMLGFSLAGAERCGKSHFLTVLISHMKKEMAKAYGCSLYPLGGDTTIEQYNRRYFHPLFEQGHVVASTAQEDVEPLIYALVFPEGGRTSNLTFYDACGANFESVRTMEEGNRNIYNSQGILFLIDPSQFVQVKERRKAKGKTVCEVDPNVLLSRIIHLIRTGSGNSDVRQKIDIPIAVCLTKMDILRPWLDPSSFVGAKPRHLSKGGFDLPDFHCCNLEVMSLIESWSGKELVNQITSQFTDYGFFAFSALGEEPAPDGKVIHIQPHRVLDPILWLLYKNGVIASAQSGKS